MRRPTGAPAAAGGDLSGCSTHLWKHIWGKPATGMEMQRESGISSMFGSGHRVFRYSMKIWSDGEVADG